MAQRPEVIAVEKFTLTGRISTQVDHLMDDAGSSKAQGLSTGRSSLELLIVEMGFTEC